MNYSVQIENRLCWTKHKAQGTRLSRNGRAGISIVSGAFTFFSLFI